MSAGFPSAALEGLLWVLLGFGPFAFGCVEPWSRAALEVLCFLLAFGVFLRGRSTPAAAGAWLWTAPAALALLALAQSAAGGLPDGPRPWTPFSSAPDETDAAARLWTAYACLAWAAPRVLIDHETARRFARAFLAVGTAVALLGFAQAWTSTDLIYWSRPTSKGVAPFGPYYNIDHAAGFLLLSLGLGAGVFASRLPGWNGGRPQAGWLKTQAALGAVLVLLFAAVAACRSQAAMLALALGCLFVGFLSGGFMQRAARLRLAAGLIAAAVVVVLLVERIALAGADAGGVMDLAVRARLLVYADAWRLLRDAPLFGAGLGTFGSLFPAYQDVGIRASVSHAHSDWLETALGGGVLSLLVALAAAAAAAWAGAVSWWKGRSREMRGLLAGGLAAGGFAAAHSLFEFNFQIPGNAAAMVLVASFLASSAAWRDKRVDRPFPDRPDPLGLALGAALLAVGLGWSLTPAAAAQRVPSTASPAARAAGAAAALDLHEAPRHWLALAGATYDLALSRDPSAPDPSLLRSAAGAALAAAEARPFDSGALALAGTALWRLKRDEDGMELLEASRRVGFSPYRPRGVRAGGRGKR